MQSDKKVNFDQILKSQIYDLSSNFGLWTVNKKLEKCVNLHINFLEMSYYELYIKMKFLAPLLLGDVKNILIPPRIYMQVWKYPPNRQPWVDTTQG